MSSETQLKTGGPPQIFKSDKALKLAEQWVDNMTKVEEDDTGVESEGRPSRLGLGAKVLRQSKFQPSNDPVERKLHARLDAHKRKAAKNAEESILSAKDGHVDDDEDEDGLESRTSAFEKKRAVASKKKQK